MLTSLLLWWSSLVPVPPPVSAVEVLPLWGGDVRSLAVHPEDPRLLAAGTTAGQVYLSRDGGHTWRDAGPSVPFAGWVVGTLRFDPRRPERLWAGLWGLWGGGLVAVSEDLGASWQPRHGPQGGSPDGGRALPREPVYDLTLVPRGEAGEAVRLLAGTLSGVWASDDDGHGWHHLSATAPGVHHVSSLWVDPVTPSTLVAGTWRRAYKSEDGGLTWRGVFAGMQLDSEVFSLRSVPGAPGELWAATCGWVYRSRDGGESWRRFQEGLPERRTPSFGVLPDGPLLAGTIAGLWTSADDGRSWRRRTPRDLAVRTILHDPRVPERILLGTEGAGVWRSDDGGETFRPSSEGLANLRVSAVSARPIGGPAAGDAPAEVVAAVHHAGPLSGLWRSMDQGRSFQQVARDLPPVLALEHTGDGLLAHTEEGSFRTPRIGEPWRSVTGFRETTGPRADPGEPLPPAAERWRAVPGGALSWGGRQLWHRRQAGDGSWVRLPVAAVRVIETGRPDWPLLVVTPEALRPWDARRERLGEPREVPFPAHRVMSVAVAGERWLLGTSGHGLVALEPGASAWPPGPPVRPEVSTAR